MEKRGIRCGKDPQYASNFKAIKKVAEIVWKWAKRITIALLILLVFLVVAIRSSYVQSKLVAYVGAHLGEQLNTTVQVDHVDIEIFRKIVLEGLLVKDQVGDTLLYVGRLACNIHGLKPRSGTFRFRELELENALFDLKVRAGKEQTNMQFIIDHFASQNKDNTEKAAFNVLSDKVLFQDLEFRFQNQNVRDTTTGIQFSDLLIRDIDLEAKHLAVHTDSISAVVNLLAFKEKSGFELKELRGLAQVASSGIMLSKAGIRTSHSEINGDIGFLYDQYAGLGNFLDEVRLSCQLGPSALHSGDLAYFVDPLFGSDMSVGISGKLRGPISDMKARDLELRFGSRTSFQGNLDLSGLPQLEETFMFVDVVHLNTNQEDLQLIQLPPFGDGRTLELPEHIARAGELQFNGDLTGFVNDFVAYGRLRTGIGELRTDMSFKKDSSDFNYKGRFISDGFHLGRFLDNKNLGIFNCDLQVDAQGTDLNTLRADVDGRVHQLQFNQYDIGHITVNGAYAEKQFEGNVEADDPNLAFIFNGLVDARGKNPVVRFNANIFHADLQGLGIASRTEYSSLAVRIDADAHLDPNDPSGSLEVGDLSYCRGSEQFDLGHAIIETKSHTEGKQLTLRSDIADAQITGVYNFQEIQGALKSIFFSVFPALQEEVQYAQADQVFELDLTMGHSDRFFALLLPELRVAPGTTVNGHINSRTFDIGVDVKSDNISWNDMKVQEMDFSVLQTMEVVALSFKSQHTMLNDSLYVEDLLLTTKGFQDEFDAVLDWKDSGLGASGRFDVLGHVIGPKQMELDLLPSRFDLGSQHWHTDEVSTVSIHGDTIGINKLNVKDGEQLFHIDGVISRDPQQSLNMKFADFNLADLNVLMANSPLELHGILEGEASVSNIYATPLLRSYLCVDSLGLNDKQLGYLTVAATWKNDEQLIDMDGTLVKDGLKSLDITGFVQPSNEVEQIRVNGAFKELDLVFLNALIPDAITDIHGQATGDVKFAGMLNDPKLSGELFLANAGLRIKELNSSFTFDHAFKMYPGSFYFDFLEVHDELYVEGRPGHKGVISGAINHENFKNWNFDIFGTADKLLALNTTSSMNDLYYGRAVASGDLGLFGYTDNLEINVRARSEKGTALELPLNSTSDVSMQDFIHFVNVDTTMDAHADTGPDLSGISMVLEIEVTPDAEISLIFDETVGDVLKGKGAGDIRMQIDPSGTFEMMGDVTIHEGDYLFTLQNIINKRFVLQHGGTIQWFGDPYRALVDLEAQYQTRTSLYDLMFEKKEAYRKRIPVNVRMHLTNTLLDPYIDFGIDVPTVDQEAKAQVQAAINTEQELNRQVFSLIVLNKFLPPPNGVQTATSTTAGGVTATTTSEVLSNQVSNWLSGISDEFDIGVNYRPGDNVTENEVQLALSTQLFNDRVAINTNVGYQYGETSYAQNPNSIIGDFEVEYKLTPDGKLRTKVFNVSNDQDLVNVNQSPTTQGVGVFYQEDFDTWRELFCKVGNIFRPNRKDKDCGD